MSKLLYNILLYVSLFFFIYPERYIFVPVSTIWLVQIIAILFAVIYFSQHSGWTEIKKIILYGLIIFFIGFYTAYLLNRDGDLGVAQRGLLIGLYPLWALWIAYLMSKSKKVISSLSLIEILVNITIFQSIVSFLFLLVPALLELYQSLIVIDDNALSVMESFSGFRLIGIGDVRYATAAVQYGLMMWGVIALRRAKYGIYGNNKVISLAVITLFCLSGILSGRMFFVMIGMTFLYVYCLYDGRFGLTIKELFKVFVPVFLLCVAAVIYFFADNEELIKWAFELFINFQDTGTFESASTNQLKEMYIFPDNFKTWIVGDGKSVGEGGGFYMGTDVGYLRSIYYWGLIGTIIYLIIQYKICRLFVKNSDSAVVNKYIYFIFFCLLVYLLKDFYSIEKLTILLVVVQAMSKRINQTAVKE